MELKCWQHNGVHFLDISTSNRGPGLASLRRVDFETCVAARRRALCRHLNFQMRSKRVMFLAFSLANALRPTTACTLSTSQLPKVPRSEASLAFSLTNITNALRATTACTVPTLQLPKVFECELFLAFSLSNVLRTPTACIHLSSGQLAPHSPLSGAYFSTLWSHTSGEKRSVARRSCSGSETTWQDGREATYLVPSGKPPCLSQLS